ncbi:MAG: apolipoprotein N-acyltransferase [Edaphobacter sp.]|uniref:apolipoprotein N-acyltransferase n=1 Tax=Edaphobacter sp. TaxID=1934404 RepID=UPI00239F2123|nr:apolipoprotein N-acyltransferase [Edaphobacter sp.]MDE1175445.1 apolipoprotein N-acyltransferase [Edaphobacter sp.]
MRVLPARLWAAAVLSGILQVLPFPIAGPVPVWRTGFCWVATLPLLWALTRTDSNGKELTAGACAALGYASGIVWYLGNCYWIYQTMYLYGGLAKPIAVMILVLFCLYLGLYHALFGWLIGLARRRFGVQGALLLSPFVWVAVELARARITGLPWDLLGITQVDNPLLIRLAPFTGAYGISFVIAAVNALWLVRIRIRERRYTRVTLTVAGVALVVFYMLGLRRIQTPGRSAATATATLVQENLEVGAAATGPENSEQELLESFSYLSRYPGERMYLGIPEMPHTPAVRFLDRGEPRDVDLIVWPESPAPFEEKDSGFQAALARLAQEAKAPVIVGNIGMDRDPGTKRGFQLYNSASFVTPQGEFAGRYDKMHLVPFGEYVPFKDLFFFAQNLLHEAGTFDAGRHRVVFAVNGHKYGTFICYESIFGDEIRQFVKSGADVLVNISNDGWYGDTSAPWQHLNMVRMRAIENHRWVLRATNTGVTASINPYGRVVEAAQRHIRTSIRVGFGYEHDVTFYAAHGDLFAYLCALVTAAAAWTGLRRRFAVN